MSVKEAARGPRPWRLRIRLLVTVLTTVVACLAVSAAWSATASATVWVADGSAKVFPSDRPTPRTAIVLYAAGGEYEAAQIAVRGAAARDVSVSWSAGSDPLLQQISTLQRVGFVHITRVSSGVSARPGDYPDPLLPAEFGTAVRVPAGSATLWLLFNVPRGTSAGDYVGELIVNEAGVQTTVPVTLKVWGFDLPKERVPAALSIGWANARQGLQGAVKWTFENQRRVFDGYYQLYKDYGFTAPSIFPVPWLDQSSGALNTADGFAQYAARYLNDDVERAGYPATRLPWDMQWPWNLQKYPAHRTAMQRYLTQVCRLYKQNGWADNAYVRLIDEPAPGAEERKIETLARLLHKASAEAGFRAKVLVTSEPRSTRFKGRPPNRFLFDDVDIWATRVYRFWDWLPDLRRQQARGKQVWMYTYSANRLAQRAPTFLIDETLADEHAIFWMMWRWDASGLIYWRVNKWTQPGTSRFRDPYAQPLSYIDGRLRFNGEASLLYPGYLPRLGLKDPHAAPRSSLRFEALRDGLEEHTYLSLAESGQFPAPYDAQLKDLAQRLAKALVDYPSGAYRTHWANIPSFSKDAAHYAEARLHLGEAMDRVLNGRGLVTATGRIVDSQGRPISGAAVSDGVLRTLSGADGSYSIRGVRASHTLTITHPRYQAARVSGSETASDHTVALTPRTDYRVVNAFESAAGIRVQGGGAGTAGPSTLGSRSARIRLLRRGCVATWHLPAKFRNLGARRQLELDVFNPGGMNYRAPWFLYIYAYDTRGRYVHTRILAGPKAWTHVTLRLSGGAFNRRSVSYVAFRMVSGSPRTFYIDGLLAR